ncbi:MAG: hypothetical protein V5804_05130 [Mucilaginibacter sp.]|uniref:hypothetical protein n=1 Tax=Mucilaginibacter sp. TaxID=1882438 RepID=UPI0034E55C1A
MPTETQTWEQASTKSTYKRSMIKNARFIFIKGKRNTIAILSRTAAFLEKEKLISKEKLQVITAIRKIKVKQPVLFLKNQQMNVIGDFGGNRTF